MWTCYDHPEQKTFCALLRRDVMLNQDGEIVEQDREIDDLSDICCAPCGRRARWKDALPEQEVPVMPKFCVPYTWTEVYANNLLVEASTPEEAAKIGTQRVKELYQSGEMDERANSWKFCGTTESAVSAENVEPAKDVLEGA